MPSDPISGKELLKVLDPSFVVGNPAIAIEGPSPLGQAGTHNFSFCKLEGEDALRLLAKTDAGMVFVHDSLRNSRLGEINRGACFVGMENPRLAFIRCLNAHFAPCFEPGIHPTAVVEEGVTLPDNVHVGPQAIIGKGAVIGEGTIVGPRAFIMGGTVLGAHVVLQTGAVIGCDGQGFEKGAGGVLEKFPQMGRVVLEDHVEIGANSTIVRGALPGLDTVVGKGTKIGHLVDIGKNVHIGKQCLISAGVILCGSVQIGDHAWLAPGCVVRQKLKIGPGATVGLGAVVISDVQSGLTVVGVPAKPLHP